MYPISFKPINPSPIPGGCASGMVGCDGRCLIAGGEGLGPACQSLRVNSVWGVSGGEGGHSRTCLRRVHH
jgi:hypothetical protein